MHTQIGALGIDVVGPNPGQLKVGEMVRIDAGCSYRHYRSDMSPVIAIGEPNAELLRIHSGMRRAMEAVLEALRPGVSVAELFELGNSVLEQERCENYLSYLGHGIGRNTHEEPVLAPDSPWTLAEDMVLSIEFDTTQPEIGMIGLEDEVVITADGHEDLSTIGRELHIVAV
jgi:Xaa-Pro aminopeptidase